MRISLFELRRDIALSLSLSLSTWRFILCKSSWTEPGFCLYLWPHLPRSGSPRLGTLSFSISTFMNLKWPILLCTTPFHSPLLFICTTSIMSPFWNNSSHANIRKRSPFIVTIRLIKRRGIYIKKFPLNFKSIKRLKRHQVERSGYNHIANYTNRLNNLHAINLSALRRWRFDTESFSWNSGHKSIIVETDLELERVLVVRTGGVINERPCSTEHRSDRRRADGVPVLAGYRAVIASRSDQCLRARAASTRQALDAARAAREGFRGRAILAQPRDLSLHVVPQIPRSARDSRPGVALQQSAGLWLEILIEFSRTSRCPEYCTVPGILCSPSNAPTDEKRATNALSRRVN